MEHTFAKLFDFDTYQVLVTKDTHPETDAPQITIRTEYEGVDVSTALSFQVSDKGDADRDAAFTKLDAAGADDVRNKVIASLLGGS